MGEAKRKADELEAAMAAISAGTLLLVRPGDKVIVRVMADVPHEQFMKLHAIVAQFLGETPFLMVPGIVEFMVARPEDAQIIAPSMSMPTFEGEPGAN